MSNINRPPVKDAQGNVVAVETLRKANEPHLVEFQGRDGNTYALEIDRSQLKAASRMELEAIGDKVMARAAEVLVERGYKAPGNREARREVEASVRRKKTDAKDTIAAAALKNKADKDSKDEAEDTEITPDLAAQAQALAEHKLEIVQAQIAHFQPAITWTNALVNANSPGDILTDERYYAGALEALAEYDRPTATGSAAATEAEPTASSTNSAEACTEEAPALMAV